jgi:hypothetical protein
MNPHPLHRRFTLRSPFVHNPNRRPGPVLRPRIELLEDRITPAINVAVVATGFGAFNDVGLNGIRDQLNDDTFFDFNAVLVDPTAVDTVDELDLYDVVVIGGTSEAPGGDSFPTYQSALNSWAQSGGGVVATGYTVFNAGTQKFRGDGGTAAAPEIDSVVPVNTSGGYDSFGSSFSITFNGTVHPVSDGIDSFSIPSGTFTEAPFSDPRIDSGATALATTNDLPTVVIGADSAGRTVYLGVGYATKDVGNTALRSGAPDRLLEQAVHWAAKVQGVDFGDAPDSYGTLLAGDGARHVAVGPKLGTRRDAEADAPAFLDGSGDDTIALDDEDGIAFLTTLVADPTAATTASLSVSATGGKLDAWIDFNSDGDFGDPGEQKIGRAHV